MNDCVAEKMSAERDERRHIIESFNTTQVPYSQRKLIHELFEEKVEQIPDAIAVNYEDCSLSYAELNDRANRLARRLRSLGVGPDHRVVLCTERSLEMVVGLLLTQRRNGCATAGE